MASPSFEDHLRLGQRAEDLTVQKLIAKPHLPTGLVVAQPFQRWRMGSHLTAPGEARVVHMLVLIYSVGAYISHLTNPNSVRQAGAKLASRIGYMRTAN